MDLDKLEKLADQVAVIIKDSNASATSVAIVRAYSQELNPDLIRAFISCGRAVDKLVAGAVDNIADPSTYTIPKAAFMDCQDSSMELMKVIAAMNAPSKIVTPKFN